MEDHSGQFRHALEVGDVATLQRLWKHVSPHLPQPTNDWQAEVTMHIARTATESITRDKRLYSHSWLCERNLPSNLPDELKPLADRLYPRVAEAVAISVNVSNQLFKPVILPIRKVMEDSVNDSYANGDTEPTGVRRRMMAAKVAETKKLVGRLSVPKDGD